MNAEPIKQEFYYSGRRVESVNRCHNIEGKTAGYLIWFADTEQPQSLLLDFLPVLEVKDVI